MIAVEGIRPHRVLSEHEGRCPALAGLGFAAGAPQATSLVRPVRTHRLPWGAAFWVVAPDRTCNAFRLEQSIEIASDMIRLGQLLKLAGAASGGADAKALIASGQVTVNGEPELRRGRQLHPGDVVRVGTDDLRIVAA